MTNFSGHKKQHNQDHRNKSNVPLATALLLGFLSGSWVRPPKWVVHLFLFKFEDISTSLTQFFIFYFFVRTKEKFQALRFKWLPRNQSWTLSSQCADLHEISESFSASIKCGCHCPSGPCLPLCTNSPKQFSWSLSTWSVVNIWIVLLSNSVKNLVFH